MKGEQRQSVQKRFRAQLIEKTDAWTDKGTLAAFKRGEVSYQPEIRYLGGKATEDRSKAFEKSKRRLYSLIDSQVLGKGAIECNRSKGRNKPR